MQKLIPLVFGFLTIIITLLGIFTGNQLVKDNFESITVVLFGFLIVLIWKNNTNEEKRDKNEDEKQNKIFEVLNRLTQAIVEIFNGSEYPKKYYEFRISTAREKVKDLTWAVFDREDKLNAASGKYLSKIKQIAENGVSYDEIFIFHKGTLNRRDRLEKLKFHYTNALNPKKGKSKYSCSFIDVRNTLDFPRIQFTIIDNQEIIFTSGFRNINKFTVKNNELLTLFGHYFDDAWEASIKLIENGNLVKENEYLIKELIKPLND